jgi:hypothetical protein
LGDLPVVELDYRTVAAWQSVPPPATTEAGGVALESGEITRLIEATAARRLVRGVGPGLG